MTMIVKGYSLSFYSNQTKKYNLFTIKFGCYWYRSNKLIPYKFIKYKINYLRHNPVQSANYLSLNPV